MTIKVWIKSCSCNYCKLQYYACSGGWWEWTGWPKNIKDQKWIDWQKETNFDFTPYLKK